MKGLKPDLFRSVTKIDDCLVVTLPAEIPDDRMREIVSAVTANAFNSGISGAILDFSMVNMLDTYLYDEIIKVSKAISLMGVRVIWVSLTPGVVCALMDLNVMLDVKTIETAPNLDQGLELLEISKRTS